MKVNNVKDKKDRIRIGVLRNSEQQAEELGNDNAKTMIKVRTIGQMLPCKNGSTLPSPSPAFCCVPGTARVLKGAMSLPVI